MPARRQRAPASTRAADGPARPIACSSDFRRIIYSSTPASRAAGKELAEEVLDRLWHVPLRRLLNLLRFGRPLCPGSRPFASG
eukprot:2203071-Prymnesium_polylepis.1